MANHIFSSNDPQTESKSNYAIGDGSASTNALLILNGATTSGFGSGVTFQRGASTKGYIGTESFVVGGAGDNIVIGAAAALGVKISVNGGAVAVTVASTGTVTVPGNVAIGSASTPVLALEVTGSQSISSNLSVTGGQSIGSSTVLQSNALNLDRTSGNAGTVFMRRANAVSGAGMQVVDGNVLGTAAWRGANDSGNFNTNTNAAISAFASESHTTGAQGAYLTFSSTPNGSIVLTERMRIDSGGNVGIGGTPTTKFEVFGSLGNLRVSTTGNNLDFTRNGANYITATGAAASLNIGAAILSIYNEAQTIERLQITPTDFILGNATAKSIYIGQSAATVAGNSLTIAAGSGGAGTNVNGGLLLLNSGATTGNQGSRIELYIVSSGQGSGTTVRSPVRALSITDNNDVRFWERNGVSAFVGWAAPVGTSSYSVEWPATAPTAGKVLYATSATATTWRTESAWLAEAVVGSAAQVTAGTATHSSLQAAHDAVASPGRIIMLLATITESVTWTKSNIKLEGGGRGSILTGNLSFSAAAVGNLIRSLKINGNVTFNAGADGNFFSDSWISNTGALTDSGAGNQTNYIQET